MQKLLYIDTSGSWMAVAYFHGNTTEEIIEPEARNASQRLVSAIQQLLKHEIPDHIVVATGPGSLTGIRIGVSTARNLCQFWSIKATPIDSLSAQAATVRKNNSGNVLVLLDGRQQKCYGAFFPAGKISPVALYDLPATEIIEKHRSASPWRLYVDTEELAHLHLNENAILLGAPDPGAIVKVALATGEPVQWPELLPLYVRLDPATSKYPGGFRHG